MAHSKDTQRDPRKEIRNPAPAPAARDNTVVQQGENQVPKERMPHERDQSSDSQAAGSASMRRMGRIAHASESRGERDTSKGAELDATYQALRKKKK
ncbi:MAG TPA: hypothetical protein VFE74_00615 [Ramlibacter sp.]|nr:hypothetical protein [Ramlibacter sp.]